MAEPCARPQGGRAARRIASLAAALGAAAVLVASLGAGPASRPEPAPAPPRPGSPGWLWAAAREAVQGDSAAARYAELARRYPRNPLAGQALLELADYRYARGEYLMARQLYRRARGSDAERARLGEALSTYALGDPTAARRLAQPLVRERTDPDTWLAALLVAQCWEAEGRVGEAFSAYRRVLTLPRGPAEPTALLGAARAAERAGQSKEAGKYLEELRKRYPLSPEAAEARSLGRAPADSVAGEGLAPEGKAKR